MEKKWTGGSLEELAAVDNRSGDGWSSACGEACGPEMKLEITVHVGSRSSSHTIDLQQAESSTSTGGQLTLSLDDMQSQRADWVEISPGTYSLILGTRSYEAHVMPGTPGSERASTSYRVLVGGQEYRVEIQDPRARRRGETVAGREGPQDILAPMPGRIVKVLVRENQEIEAGQGLLVMEAMKMQNELRAPRPGRVEKIYVREDLGVEAGFKLLRLV
jgi:biotin carboxyl carrier protein